MAVKHGKDLPGNFEVIHTEVIWVPLAHEVEWIQD